VRARARRLRKKADCARSIPDKQADKIVWVFATKGWQVKKLKPVYRCDSCDAELDTKRRFCDDRCKEIELCKSIGTTKYRNKFVAPAFQAMIRAEAGAKTATRVWAVVSGGMFLVPRQIGQCVCITCGGVHPWKGSNMLDSGHFCSRKDQGVLFDEQNCHPQCKNCNKYGNGRPQEYRLWMESVYGIEVIERLETTKRQSIAFSRDELVDMRIEYSRRLKAAEHRMKGG